MKKPKAAGPKLTAVDCVAALKTRYKGPDYAFFEQVANGTGFGVRGWADGFAMGIWPSRGHEFFGFEIKVSRTDWRKELDNPAKAENVQQYTDRWNIVAPVGLIQPAELPPTWGLIEVVDATTLRTVVAAPKLTPVGLPKSFIAAILRRQHELFNAALDDAFKRGRADGAANGAPELARKLESTQQQLKDISAKLTDFEGASGLQVQYGWPNGKELGEAVKQITDLRNRTERIEHLRHEANGCRKDAERSIQWAAEVEKEIAALLAVRTMNPNM